MSEHLNHSHFWLTHMNINIDTTPALIYVVDRDAESRDGYQAMAERLGVEMRFSTSVEPLLANDSGDLPSCLVLDLGSFNADSEKVRQDLLKRTVPLPTVLLIDSDVELSSVLGLSAGALAVLQRPAPMNVLERYLKFAIHRRQVLVELEQKFKWVKHMLEDLTPRQQKVLDLATTGMPNKTIAARLGVSQRTVETERAKVLKIFSADSFCDVTAQVGAFRVMDMLDELQTRETLLKQGIYPAPAEGCQPCSASPMSYVGDFEGDMKERLMLISQETKR